MGNGIAAGVEPLAIQAGVAICLQRGPECGGAFRHRLQLHHKLHAGQHPGRHAPPGYLHLPFVEFLTFMTHTSLKDARSMPLSNVPWDGRTHIVNRRVPPALGTVLGGGGKIFGTAFVLPGR